MATAVEDVGVRKPKNELDSAKIGRKSNKKNRRSHYVPKFCCFRSDFDSPSIDTKNEDGSIDMVSASAGKHRTPSHLIIMVNGILGSAKDWGYAAKQFLKAYPEDVVVHCSEENSSTLTFDGVDVMGGRLAKEVLSAIERYPDVRKISFIGHSLGGLIARYAIARLYGRNCLQLFSNENGGLGNYGSTKSFLEEDYKDKVAGLEPINFITLASPHLGSRGHKQVPMFCGIHTLEKVARQTSGLLGRTGKHLFLTDSDDGKPPLLLRMVNDYDDLPFISALQSFKRRIVYANVHFDNIVGWSTASLCHPKELRERRRHLSRNDKYRHIVNVETENSVNALDGYPSESIIDDWKTFDTEAMMEVMLRGLTKLNWERVDVKFNGNKQRLFAHCTIQVTRYWNQSNGADVIQHMVDNFLLSRPLVISMAFLLISSLTQEILLAEGRLMTEAIWIVKEGRENMTMARSLIGSRPPRCERRCRGCGHCEAIQVPISPQLKLKPARSHSAPTTQFSRGDDLSNYMPMSWKCKCGHFIFNP
ncbi:hypothetical protein Nepgr_019838 [Nepenthes gracilis]|uniref:DUF676 domain-containing protein n=1 Tax=Nepenthes gracilis TaxID=150966 RepID=A0AAD3XUH5_NEPGR|nr:hypothetical protein Nepgr_019838 [Nepenthes gracilis]